MKRLLSFLISMAIVLGTLPAVVVSAEETSLNGSGTPTELPEIKLVLMGDSLMDSVWNTTSYSWNKTGWESKIGSYLNNKVELVKHGHSGQTIEMFMNGRQSYHYCDWETIKTEFGAGDYVIIA
ncbi:MAG: hypothetical protein IIX21_02480, partial [Clostridia bacterium]|nr:hypothetical protein [Clostridia bacterium]